MSETLSVREKLADIEAEGGEETKEPQLSSEEQTELDEAIASGYNPDGHDKDGNTLSPKEFMARKPLFNKIGNMRNELDDLKAEMSDMRGDSKKMAQAFMKKEADLLEQLKAKKEQALNDLDTDEVRRLDKEIETVATTQQEKTETTAQPTEKEWSDAYIGFLKENRWYDDNPGLKSAADLYGKQFSSENPNASPKAIYEHVATEVKREFADRFEEKTNTNSRVSTSTRRAASSVQKKGIKLSDLDYEEQRVVQVMANAVGKSVEDYMKSYKLED